MTPPATGKRRTYLTVALLVWLACTTIPVLWNYSQLYERILDDRRFPALSRYALEPTPGVALVGSSMIYRLFEGYFQTRLRNIAIGGRSPITGLAIIASYSSVPPIIVVETNVLARTVEPALVEKFGNNEAAPFRWFWADRVAISYFYSWLKYKSESDNVARLPRQPPSSYDIKASLDEAEAEYNSHGFDAQMAENAEMLRRQVADLESRGCKIYLVEMPYPGHLGDSHFAQTARALAHKAFPERAKWPDIDYHVPELRWIDASHMDERSAIIVAREIDAFLGRGTNSK